MAFITRRKVDTDQIAPYLGTYHNDVLGDVELVLHQVNTVSVDFGEYQSNTRRLVLKEKQYLFDESFFIGKTITLGNKPDGKAIMTCPGDEDKYTFVKSGQISQTLSQP